MPPAKFTDDDPKSESPSTDDLALRIRDLENTLAATRAGMPLSLIPEHGAGPGDAIRETWSQAEQEAAISAEPMPL